MTVLIIGGTGFIGRRLIPLLAQHGEESVVMDINTRLVRELSERQARVAALQLWAYLSIQFGNVVPQDNTTGYHFEPRMIIVNTGTLQRMKFAIESAQTSSPSRCKAILIFLCRNSIRRQASARLVRSNDFIIWAPVPHLYSDAEIIHAVL